jgi:hypothetical protein
LTKTSNLTFTKIYYVTKKSKHPFIDLDSLVVILRRPVPLPLCSRPSAWQHLKMVPTDLAISKIRPLSKSLIWGIWPSVRTRGISRLRKTNDLECKRRASLEVSLQFASFLQYDVYYKVVSCASNEYENSRWYH